MCYPWSMDSVGRTSIRKFTWLALVAIASNGCGSDSGSSTHGSGGTTGDATSSGASSGTGATSSGGASSGSGATGGAGATAGGGGNPGSGGAGGSRKDASVGGKPDGSVGPKTDGGPGEKDGGANPDAGTTSDASVLQHHHSARRDGVYVDAAFTKSAAATLHQITTFQPTLMGNVYAQLLFLDGGVGGRDVLFAATESDNVSAVDATTGETLWQKNVGAPVKLASLPCGNINPLGITGTPIIDLPSRGIYFDAMTGTAEEGTDGGIIARHLVFGLSIDDGHVLAGFPVDVSATVSFEGVAFDSLVQNQRGALAIHDGVLYVPYGGHAGDCSTYHGWVVGFPLATPRKPKAWATGALHGGSWGPSGVASDETGIFAATGNTTGTKTWMGGEAVIHFADGPVFDGQPKNYFTPSNWHALDVGDLDLGGMAPVLFDMPGSTPSKLAVVLGKNGVGYLVNRTNLGGIGTGDGANGEGVFSKAFATGKFITAAATYTTAKATYVVGKGLGMTCPKGSDLLAMKVVPGSPPSLAFAWCGTQKGLSSPIVTTPDGKSDVIVWGIGSGVARFTGFDGDTGAIIFSTTSNDELVRAIRPYVAPIAAKGHLYIAGDNRIYKFAVGK